MRRTIAIFASAAAALVGSACAGTTDGQDIAGNSARGGSSVTPQPPAAKPSDYPTETSDPAEETTAESGPKTFTMGEKGTISNETDGDVLEVTVTSPRTVKGDEFTKPEKGRFLAVTVTFRALASGQDVNPYDFVVVGADGQRYQPTFGPDSNVTQLNSGTLNRGETSKGAVVFDVPKTGVTGVAYAPLNQVLGTWKL